MDNAFLAESIAALKVRIRAYEAALLALATNGGMQSYTLDTGQGRQTVTRYDIGTMERALAGLYNQCTILDRRLNGGGSILARPAW